MIANDTNYVKVLEGNYEPSRGHERADDAKAKSDGEFLTTEDLDMGNSRGKGTAA